MNKVILIGNLTKDPELTTTNNGINVTKFSVAVQRKFKNANGERESDFINIVAWRSVADLVSKYTKKGSKVAIVGEIQSRSYEVDGVKKYITEVIADEVEFISTRNNDSDGRKETEEIAKLELIDDLDGSLPF